MTTINQLLKNPRKKRLRKSRVKPLKKCPQKKGVCLKVYTTSPKKPNSAVRKIAKVKLSTKQNILVNIPGQGHNLQEYSVVLVRGGRVRDMPGIRFRLIRGKYDFSIQESFKRKNKRSKHGIPLEKI
ncbi:30S ribosomal protein S12 [archaeon]|nr:30S ribosomal protein S12 [archaeon]